MKLFGQLEQPGPAIGPLKRLAVWPRKVGGLSFHVVFGEVIVQSSADVRSLFQVGEEPQQPRKHPMAMDTRVPIKATIKRRMKCTRASYIGTVIHHVIHLIWILSAHTLEREAGKVRCLLAGKTETVLYGFWIGPGP